MPLDRIPSAAPEIQPAKPAKEFPDMYITHFGIGFESVGRQPAEVIFQNYNYDTKEISDNRDARKKFQIANLWDEVNRSALVADTAGRLTYLLGLLYRESILRAKLSGVDYEGRAADAAELHVVQTALGAQLDTIPEPFVETVMWAKPMEPAPPEPEPAPEPTSQEVWDSLSFTTIV